MTRKSVNVTLFVVEVKMFLFALKSVYSLTGLNCLAYDEAIIAQQDRIQQEVIGLCFSYVKHMTS